MRFFFVSTNFTLLSGLKKPMFFGLKFLIKLSINVLSFVIIPSACTDKFFKRFIIS